MRLRPNAVPYKCRARIYSLEKSKFLENFNRELVALGMARCAWNGVRERPKSMDLSSHAVRKPHSNEFRQMSDYRPLNELKCTSAFSKAVSMTTKLSPASTASTCLSIKSRSRATFESTTTWTTRTGLVKK